MIKGKVQGVGFRYATQDKAVELGIVGWVRNLPSGEVETEATGTEQQITAFVSWCHEGPSHARVDLVQKLKEESKESVVEKEFKILR